MAKSLGNFMTIREALKKYDYKVLRYLFSVAGEPACIRSDNGPEVVSRAVTK